MTEEIIKECKNCDALGIDSEIGVYYCCLSHRQDDLPKEFTCNDFTPNKQLKRLEQENKELKKQIESDKGLITVGGKQQYEYLQRIDELKQENKELKTKLDVFAFTISQYESTLEEIRNYCNRIEQGSVIGTQDCLINSIKNITNEVLNESK